MEEVFLLSVRLISTDKESEQIVERLKLDGISCSEDADTVLLSIVLVSSEDSLKYLDVSSLVQDHRQKLVLLQTSGVFDVGEQHFFNAILSFHQNDDAYSQIKSFLYCSYNFIEFHSLISVDFCDFYSIINGRNIISMQRYVYATDVEEALSQLKYDSTNKQDKYIYAIRGAQSIEEEGRLLKAFAKHISAKLCSDDFRFNIVSGGTRQVVLLTATPY
ncbi:hypothetical protein [Prevotella fusca]|uniref:Uncharacterized protein n=1 Tax=Prevotella fusca JCM 17724 TaxID=1236517 RepID=A0A0K1NHU8_9BACT|nr:hypothetical protein [Prevotella fusca]AKU68659.1 hypothetical protein ADJ77_02110 [Prevotella fusca JCM 17724]QUB86289.1 hypothetical protein J5A51_09255 [Prevotella fusca JCM 17724]